MQPVSANKSTKGSAMPPKKQIPENELRELAGKGYGLSA